MSNPGKRTPSKSRTDDPAAEARDGDDGRTGFRVVGIGASAGGLEAYSELFRLLPTDTGMAYVLIQHLAPRNRSLLGGLIQKRTSMPVRAIADGVALTPNTVFIVQPNTIPTLFHGVFQVEAMPEPPKTGGLIDTFLTSLADDCKADAIGIVLSGNGSDGTNGLRRIKAVGGTSLIQSPQSAKYDGMPQAAVEHDHPDRVADIAGLVNELVNLANEIRRPTATATEARPLDAEHEAALRRIFALVRSATGTDFSVYKRPTILRRIDRRMAMGAIDDLPRYYAILQNTPREVEALFSDLVINVTSFFRDPEAFEFLKIHVLPQLILDHPVDADLRIWVPACSTGEEVYSIAMSVREVLDKSDKAPRIKIYGTDVAERSVRRARAGVYPKSIEANVSKARLKRFFENRGGAYKVRPTIRDLCIFSVQDVTTDPPIHQVHLLSCRNLLIYLSPGIQKRLLETFHYALDARGFLLLGSAENVGSTSSLFRGVDEKAKVFVKIPLTNPPRRPAGGPRPSEGATDGRSRPSVVGRSTVGVLKDPASVAEATVLERFAPAWILVNEGMEIVHFKGQTQNLVTHRSGQASWHLAKTVRDELVSDVRILIHRARTATGPVRKDGLELRVDKRRVAVDVEVVPIVESGSPAHYLVLFHERPAGGGARSVKGAARPSGRTQALRQELIDTKNSLRLLLDDQSATNDQLQGINEELQSANEELQSTNEELETAKEELQSTNEELITVNEELSERNFDLGQVNEDLSNILNSAQVAIVMVDSQMLIRRLTLTAGRMLNLVPGDLGRRLTEFKLGFPDVDLHEKLVEVVRDQTPSELEARDRAGRYFTISMRPFRTRDRRTDGAVVTFTDVDALKQKERLARAAQVYAENIVETIHDPLIVMDGDLQVRHANTAFFRTFLTTPAQTVGEPFFALGNGQWNAPALRELVERILPKRTEVRRFLVDHVFESIGRRRMLINAQRLVRESPDEILIMLAIRDVTDDANDSDGGPQ